MNAFPVGALGSDVKDLGSEADQLGCTGQVIPSSKVKIHPPQAEGCFEVESNKSDVNVFWSLGWAV